MKYNTSVITFFVIPSGATSGQRIVLDGVQGEIDLYNAANELVGQWKPSQFGVFAGSPNVGQSITIQPNSANDLNRAALEFQQTAGKAIAVIDTTPDAQGAANLNIFGATYISGSGENVNASCQLHTGFSGLFIVNNAGLLRGGAVGLQETSGALACYPNTGSPQPAALSTATCTTTGSFLQSFTSAGVLQSVVAAQQTSVSLTQFDNTGVTQTGRMQCDSTGFSAFGPPAPNTGGTFNINTTLQASGVLFLGGFRRQGTTTNTGAIFQASKTAVTLFVTPDDGTGTLLTRLIVNGTSKTIGMTPDNTQAANKTLTAQWFATPGVAAIVLDPNWVAIPLTNGWTGDATRVPLMRLMPDGTVQFKGFIFKAANPVNGEQWMSAVAAQYRPQHTWSFLTPTPGRAYNGSQAVEVHSDGTGIILDMAAASGSISLDNVRYATI